MPQKVSVREVRFFMRNVCTRMPFKYGAATLTSVPIFHAQVQVELSGGGRAMGIAADILPPKWFDKDPVKDYRRNIDDLLFVASAAAAAYQAANSVPQTVFELWWEGYMATLAAGDERDLNHLTSSHGSSLMERAVIDALGTGLHATYFELLQSNTLGLDFSRIYAELSGVTAADITPKSPLASLFVRHTVGLVDPIRKSDISVAERLDDGLPQALEEYIAVQSIRYFKVKVNGDLDRDLERLRDITSLLDRLQYRYFVSLDGNEQYDDIQAFLEFLARIEEDSRLARFYASILYIEQPLERGIALDEGLAPGIAAVSVRKPLLVDESDGDLDVFNRAIALGYRGVSVKNCKGLIKALANLALARCRDPSDGYFLTGEDLMNLPVVPLQQDLTQLAVLGVDHAERNGHHYVRGLDHLSYAERLSCSEVHSSLYRDNGTGLALYIADGRIDLSSLQVPGLGVGVPVDVDAMVPLEKWDFNTLA